ncbi:hypothetical protein P4S72_07855 [Vibrio sp. PP-XX7]
MLHHEGRFGSAPLEQALQRLLAHHIDMLRARIHQAQADHARICLTGVIELDLQFIARRDVSTVDEIDAAQFDSWHAQLHELDRYSKLHCDPTTTA